MKVKIKKLHPDAVTPTYGSDGAAAFDLYAIYTEDEKYGALHRKMGRRIHGGETLTLRTGLAFEIPAGHVMKVYSRSGHGFGADMRLANCVGIIDSDYRGEVKVKLTRDNAYDADGHLTISHGDRIAQAIIVPIPRIEFEEVAELSDTARGTGGFGSTGK